MLIVFDVDGTLVGGIDTDHRCFDEAFFDVTKLPLPGDRWDRVTEFTAQAIVREALHDWAEADSLAAEATIRAGFLARLRAAHTADGQAFPAMTGGPEMLDALATSNSCRVAIATGCWRETSRFKLTAAGYRVDAIEFASSSDCYRRVDIIRTVMDRLGAEASETVYVGDQLWDYRAARELGLHFVGVGVLREELHAAGARTLDSLSADALLHAAGRRG